VAGLIPTSPGGNGGGAVAPSAATIYVRTPEQVKEARRVDEVTADLQKAPVLKGLAAHVNRCFAEASTFKARDITPRLLACQQQVLGKYSDEKLARIRQVPGASELFFNVTNTKTTAAESWLYDIALPVGDKPWTLTLPSPIADLPDDAMAEVAQDVAQAFLDKPVESDQSVREEFYKFGKQLYSRRLKAIQDEAEKRIGRMERVIEDQLVEGDFIGALEEFIKYLCRYPIAILKGPVIVRKKRLSWKGNALKEDWVDVFTWSAVDPHDYFPSPNARSPNQGYITERIHFDPRELAAMKGESGWSTEAIDEVLSEFDQRSNAEPVPNTVKSTTGESERAQMEERDMTIRGGASETSLVGVEFWGAVQYKLLQEWGPGLEDKEGNDWCEIVAIQIGDHVVHASKNPHPLGVRPYSEASWEKVPNRRVGEALGEKMRDIQEMVNGTSRALQNNVGMCALPQKAIDLDQADPRTIAQADLFYPAQVHTFRSTKSPRGGPAVDYFMPESRAKEFMAVIEFYERRADDRTQIPRYAHGDDRLAGTAGKTATGASLFFEAASRSIKRVIGSVDRNVIRDAINRMYRWNMMYHKDPLIKGDAIVAPHGLMAILVMQQTQLRLQEFMERTNNPEDRAIMGWKGRARLLRLALERMKLDIRVDDIIPDDETLETEIETARTQAQAQAGETAGVPGQPPALPAEANR